jgi:hypothetical protein
MINTSLYNAINIILLIVIVVLFSVGIYSNHLYTDIVKVEKLGKLNITYGLTEGCIGNQCVSYYSDKNFSAGVNVSIAALTFSIATILVLAVAIVGCLTKFKHSKKIACVCKLLGLYFMIIVIMLCLVFPSMVGQGKQFIISFETIDYGLILVFVATFLLAGMKLYWNIMN